MSPGDGDGRPGRGGRGAELGAATGASVAGVAFIRLLDKLDRVRRTGNRATARCPAHEDRRPSLSLAAVEGRVLVHCHAGCATADVVAALGLVMADLFDDPAGITYRYDDGRLVLRSPDKRFRQAGATAGQPQLYRAAQVVAAVARGDVVYLVEGEQDVHALEALGAVATTAPMGAGNFGKVDVGPLRGAHVVVLPDQDDAGQRWCRDVLAALDGVAAEVRVAAVRAGKDAADHVAAGFELADLDLVDAPGGLDVVRAADVEPSRVVYLWEGRVPLGGMTLMPGEEGIGKTTLGVRVMADATRGVLPGEFYGTPRDVVVVAAEDGLTDVLVPRFRAAGADLDRVHIVRARLAVDGSAHEVILPRDLPALSAVVRRVNAVLVWVDSLVTVLPDDMKSISYKDTSKVLRRLGAWAEQEKVAVVAPWHLNKSHGSDTAVRIMDSRAFRTAVRSMLLVVADPDTEDGGAPRGIVALDKANAGPLAVPGLRYTIRPAHYVVAEVDTTTGELREVPASCGVVEWAGEVAGNARELARSLLVPRVDRDDEPGTWLREHLDAAGETPREKVISAARAAGFSLDQVKRAARRLGVHSRDETGQTATGRPFRRALWSLPGPSRAAAHLTHPTAPTAPTGETDDAPTTSIDAGQAQSVQSGQSGHGCTDWGVRCTDWERPLHVLSPDPEPETLDFPGPGSEGGVEIGPCAACRAPTRRYGEHGQPLCHPCRSKVVS